MDERFLPDWNEDALSLGRPKAMDTPTLIEWIERQLETPEEGVYRELMRSRLHQKWHDEHPGIYTCCINLGLTSGSISASSISVGSILTVNEIRSKDQMEEIKERFQTNFYADNKLIYYMDEGVKYSQLADLQDQESDDG